METQLPTEAQKLIALSIGKITQSRQRRGGINLHKNLLVATVLHKARTIYIMENYTTYGPEKSAVTTEVASESNSPSIPDGKTPEMEVSEEETSGSMDSCSTAPSNHGEEKRSRSEHVLVKDISKKDKENTPPKVHSNNEQVSYNKVKCADDRVEALETSHLCNKQTTNLKTNGPCREHSHSNRDYVSTGDCQRCVKRRRGSGDASYEVSSPVKKPKIEDNSCDSNTDSTCSEHIQAEPSQISNLVSIFNSGFSGLCSVSDGSSVQVYSSSELLSNNGSSVTSYSIDSNKSCGTHLKENFVEPVSAIALTV